VRDRDDVVARVGAVHPRDGGTDPLDDVDEGETVFFPEYLAWTPAGSGRAFARLIALAQARNINIVTSLNIGTDLHEDLPGRDPDARYNALVIFTRHGVVNVPEAKVTPRSYERNDAEEDQGIGVAPYDRINRLRRVLELVKERLASSVDTVNYVPVSADNPR